MSDNSDYGELVVEAHGYNQDNVRVAKIIYNVLIYKSGQHPYYGNNDFNYNLQDYKFSAYKVRPDGAYIEQAGIDFEDLKVGEVYRHAPNKFITKHESQRQALRSLNWNPMHIDPNYCQRYFPHDELIKSCRIPEMLVLGAITACTTRTFGKVVANLGWTDIKIERHVKPEEHYRVESTILETRTSHSRPT